MWAHYKTNRNQCGFGVLAAAAAQTNLIISTCIYISNVLEQIDAHLKRYNNNIILPIARLIVLYPIDSHSHSVAMCPRARVNQIQHSYM